MYHLLYDLHLAYMDNIPISLLHNNNNHQYAFQHELGACDDSLCLPSRFVLSVTMGTCNVQTLGVRQQNIVPDFSRLLHMTDTTQPKPLLPYDVSIVSRMQQEQSLPHDSEVNRAQHCAPMPASEWINLIADVHIVMVHLPVRRVACMKVRWYPLNAQHTDAVRQHASQ